MDLYAARLVDKEYAVQFPIFFIDLKSKESLIDSIDAIKNSKYPEEQVTDMLAHVKFLSTEYLGDPDIQALFADIEASENVLDIEVTGENYPLVYGALDQYVETFNKGHEDPDEAADTDSTIEEQHKEIEALLETIESLNSDCSEKACNVEACNKEICELKAILEERETEIAESEKKLTSVIERLALYEEDSRTTLVKKILEMAKALSKPYTRGKSDEDLVTFLSSRSDEVLEVMCEDYSQEVEGLSEETIPDTESTNTKVDNPLEEANAAAISEELYKNITVEEDKEDNLPYRIILGEDYDKIMAAIAADEGE